MTELNKQVTTYKSQTTSQCKGNCIQLWQKKQNTNLTDRPTR